MKEYTVQATDNGIRLDKFLFRVMPAAPSGVVYKSLRKKRVKVNGKRVTDGSAVLKTGDVLELYINDEFFERSRHDGWMNSKVDAEFAYEDENIAVLYKPGGLPSQDIEQSPGYSLESGFRKTLFKRGGFDAQAAYIPSLCHRIDRNTSGLVIAAKNLSAHRIVTEKIKSKEIRKFYLCRVEGLLKPEQSEVSGYILRAGRDKVRFSKSEQSGGKAASLRYRVLEFSRGSSLAEVELLTGRTHQIRAVMSALGHPICGDIKYGAKTRSNDYQDLKAYRLIFDFNTDAGELEYLRGKEVVYGEY